jgi:subtilisin family serine protease
VRITASAVAALIGLAVAVVAGGRAHAELVRKPTPAELSAAAAAGVSQRWERVPAGQIFPVSIRYTTDLQTKETASRVGIAPGAACAAAVDATLAGQARRDGCVAALRADYTDQMRGAVYTLGVLAFGSTAQASAFYRKMPSASYPATGLRALAVAGSPAARFGEATRQSATARLAGPYVVLAIAGYADGRPASNVGERRDSVFDPASQLVSAVAAPLAKPVAVRCGSGEWACSDPVPPLPPPPTSLEQVRPDEMQTLDQIHVPDAWQVSKGSGVTVAVLDTGADANAPDLAGDVTTGPDYTQGANPPGFQPPHDHGTYIASLIAAHGSGTGGTEGVVGVAPEAKILSVRVILDDGEPGLVAYNQDQRFADAIGKGIYYAVRHGAKVINMSLGSPLASGYMRAAVAYAVAHGVVVVASAGNNGTSSGFSPYVYPASFTGVIAVAAVTDNGARASFSEQNASVVVSAPGTALGAGPGGEYIEGEGTSPAAAFVSGVAALIKSRYPHLSPALVEQALVTSADHRPRGGYSAGTGFGEVNAPAALRAAAKLAAAKPATGLAANALFGAPGQAAPQGGPGPIQVVHRDTAVIAGYAGASGAGVLCAIITLILLTRSVRRSRRDRREQLRRQSWQQPAWAGQAGPQPPPVAYPPRQAGYPPPVGYPPPASYPPPATYPPQRNYQPPPASYPPQRNYQPPPASYPPQRNYQPPPASYPPPPGNYPPPSVKSDDYPNSWFDPR